MVPNAPLGLIRLACAVRIPRFTRDSRSSTPAILVFVHARLIDTMSIPDYDLTCVSHDYSLEGINFSGEAFFPSA